MIRILSIIGTRPEVIKMAPVLKELSARPPGEVRSVICMTGQHRELLDRSLGHFAIRPDYDLDLMERDQSLARLTSRLLDALDPVVRKARPDWILAQGDTATAFAAGMAAYFHRVRFGHVAAGLRTGDRYRPYPEERFRRLADDAADVCFAPTETARQALLREGKPAEAVHVTGNTVVDALLDMAGRDPDGGSAPLPGLSGNGRVVLVTAHRRESFGAPLESIFSAIRDLAASFASEGVVFAYPIHPNPNVREPAERLLSGIGNVRLLEPLDYRSLIRLMRRSAFVMTDSGGIQEEAPTFGVPVLVMRDATERPEGIAAGVARLVGTRRKAIVEEASRLLRDPAALADMTGKSNPYGDGRAASRIVSILLDRGRP